MPNDASFLDTSGWMALLNAGDQNHASAALTWREIVRLEKLVILTDWIIAETGNGLARTRHRELFVEAVRLLSTSPHVRIVYVNDDLLERALNLYQARPDKAWGLIDCASFVVMMQQGIGDAITADHHFEQAGFRCLLSDPNRKGGASNGPMR